MSALKNEVGNRYGHLVVVARGYHTGPRRATAMWLCACDCGGWSVVGGGTLRYGHTKSCGCRQGRSSDPIALRRWLVEGATNGPCADCANWPTHPCQMDLDHMYEKEFSLGGAWKNYSTSDLAREIGKCDLVCANCHRLRTYQSEAA